MRDLDLINDLLKYNVNKGGVKNMRSVEDVTNRSSSTENNMNIGRSMSVHCTFHAEVEYG